MKNTSRINIKSSGELEFKCLVCDAKIKPPETKQLCDECLDALKSLILEKRADSTLKSLVSEKINNSKK